MRIEVEYRAEEGRWHWRVYSDGTFQPPNVLVRAGMALTHDEAVTAAHEAKHEYLDREVIA